MTGTTDVYGAEPRLLGGRYQLGEILGYGGMAEVYRGRDVRLGREVAVKTLRADLARDPTFHARFRREAQSAAGLNHPAIVSVYDTGEDNTGPVPTPYIVMEYVEGRTLRDVIAQEGRLMPQRALEIVSDVCGALDYSHRMQIVHRDIKPANVMLTNDHQVKVMDFGIARALTGSTSTMTQTAQVIGTAQYLSPEQARGEPVDARSDVYTTGVLLYELLTAQPPFRGDSPVAVAYQHVQENPQPPSTVDPDMGPEVDAIVLKAMAKDPAQRYQSAGEMRDDCERLLAGQQIHAMAAAPPWAEDRTAAWDGRTSTYDRTAYAPAAYDATGASPVVRTDGGGGGRRRADNGQDRSWLVWVGIAVAVIAVFVVAALVAKNVLGGGSASTKSFTMPNFKNSTQEIATNRLRAAGYNGKLTIAKQPNNQTAAGIVLAQDPATGTKVKLDAPIQLTVSSGPAQVTVPDVKGQTPDAATTALRNAGFTPITNTAPAGTAGTPGTVSSQDPAGNTKVDAGTTVNIFVISSLVTVQDVSGKSYEQASQILSAQGLKVQAAQYQDSTQPDGTVISQNPNAGLQVASGTQVTLTVSRQVTPTPTDSPTDQPTAQPTDGSTPCRVGDFYPPGCTPTNGGR